MWWNAGIDRSLACPGVEWSKGGVRFGFSAIRRDSLRASLCSERRLVPRGRFELPTKSL